MNNQQPKSAGRNLIGLLRQSSNINMKFLKLSADIFQSMENLHTLNLGSNLIEEFSKPLITEWFTNDDVQELEETQNSSNFKLILDENPVSIRFTIFPFNGAENNQTI